MGNDFCNKIGTLNCGAVAWALRPVLEVLRTCYFTRYFLPAGVSAQWLRSIFPVIDGTNLWLTGQDLITLKTRIITHPINNTTPRVASVRAEELG